MKKTLLCTIFLTALTTSAVGQYVRINGKDAKNALYFNYDRLWSYNQYEASRWGGGLKYDINFNPNSRLKCLSLDGYLGYGYADQRFKWGLMADLQLRSSRKPHVYVGFVHDLVQDANLYLQSPSITDLSVFDGFMAWRFSEVNRFYLGGGWKMQKNITLGAELRYSSEQRLYDHWGFYYDRDVIGELPHYRLLEARLSAEHSCGLHAELLLGSGHSLFQGYQNDFPFYARLLAQYFKEFKISLFTLRTHGQFGATGRNLPYSRMFDLGGHWGSPLLLTRSLVSARPSEFTANLFAAASAKFGFTNPLFKFHFSMLNIGMRPRPFVQAGAAWGHLWGENEEGILYHDELALMSPSRGIAEVGAGIDGLVRWGAVDWGLALFYRITPSGAFYHFDNRANNLSLLFTASLSL